MRKTHQVVCSNCAAIFSRDTRDFKKSRENSFCSRSCYREWKTTSYMKECKCCGSTFSVERSSTRIFCCQSCAARYNNKMKKTGYRRSKFEFWLEKQLLSEFPDETILFNHLLEGYELDVYLPKRRIAFEVNGITHYSPIYGPTKYERILFNDEQKRTICDGEGILLVVVNISNLKRFSPEAAMPIYEKEIFLRLKNSTLTGLEPTSNS